MAKPGIDLATLSDQDVVLEVHADPDAPPVHGDEDRLGQVFVNLVHNAVKFLHP